MTTTIALAAEPLKRAHLERLTVGRHAGEDGCAQRQCGVRGSCGLRHPPCWKALAGVLDVDGWLGRQPNRPSDSWEIHEKTFRILVLLLVFDLNTSMFEAKIRRKGARSG